MRLTCAGKEFLLELPTEDTFYYSLEGERVSAVDFSVSPSDIAREMFLPEDWGKIPEKRVQLTAYDEAAQLATLEIHDDAGRMTRRLLLHGVPWVITRNERFDAEDRLVAITEMGDYRDFEGVHMPAWVEAVYPSEETSMRLEFRQLRPNVRIEGKYFDIDGRAAELGITLDRTSAAPQQGKY